MKRRDTLALIERLGQQTAAAASFLAPCVRGGRVVTLVDGLVQRLTPAPRDFEGWGVFAPQGRVAKLVQPASARLVAKRMRGAPEVGLILIRKLRRSAWLAMPLHGEAFATRFGPSSFVTVQLVEGADALAAVRARVVGNAFWFARVDRRADRRRISTLREAVGEFVALDELDTRGLTPEWRAAYAALLDWRLGAPTRIALRGEERDRRRLEHALRMGGGRLNSFVDRGDFWTVEWLDRDGYPQVSAIDKTNLTVIDSGICLSGYDQDFDLQSLVGVFAQREPWA